jgi:hypothetical protein
VGGLPAPSRRALERALDVGSEQPPAPHVVGAALLELLAAASEAAPVLVLVDDHQCLDAPSRQALAFAVRRLAAERVCVLLAHRSDADTAGAPDLPALPLWRSAPSTSSPRGASCATACPPSPLRRRCRRRHGGGGRRTC